MARRKREEAARALLQAAKAEAQKGLESSGAAATLEERRRMVLLTPQRPEGEIIRFEVIPANRLLTSHRPADFQPEKKYPEGVQERAYHLDEAEQAKVVRGAQLLRPELVLARTPSALDGPPLVTEAREDGTYLALGGNGRGMMLRRAYSLRSEPSQRYREALIRQAADFGLDGQTIRAVHEQPVLVRVVEGLRADSPREELAAAVRRFNEGLTQQLDAKTLGVAQARVLSPESVRQLGDLLGGDQDATLREAMAAHPRVFREVLERDRVVTPQNVSQWFGPAWARSGGALTDEAKDRIEAMFLGLVLGTPDRMKATGAALQRKLERAVPSLVAVRGAVPAFDLIPTLQKSVDVLNDAAARGLTLEDALGQGNLFGGAEQEPRVVALAQLLHTHGQRAVGEAFRRWARAAIHDPNQGTLFGDAPTPEGAFAVLMSRHLVSPTAVGDTREKNPRQVAPVSVVCPRCAGSKRIVPWAGVITGCPTCGGSGYVAKPPAEDARQKRLINPEKPMAKAKKKKTASRKKTATSRRRRPATRTLRLAAKTTGALAQELTGAYGSRLPDRVRVVLIRARRTFTLIARGGQLREVRRGGGKGPVDQQVTEALRRDLGR